ncbi:hypothetical protein LguiB_010526 [Lonicera macranthoides]
MDEKNNPSIEALKVENRELDEEGEETEEEDAEEFDDDDDDGGDKEGQQQISEIERLPRSVGAELPVSQSETLAGRSDLVTCSRSLSEIIKADEFDLAEVPVEYTLRPHELAESKVEVASRGASWLGVNGGCQVEVSHQQALSSVTAHDAQTRTQALPSSSPSMVAQSNSSAPSPTLNEHRVSSVSNSNSTCVAEMDPKNSSDRRIGPTLRIVRTPSTDGYNWRKYGQKQVKIPQGYRSYYKCTYSECYAKKIECCDHFNCVIEIIYKGQHNHEPPRKVNYARESGLALSVVESNISNLATSSKEPKQEVPETYRQNSSGSDGNAEVIAKEQHVDEPEPKRRQKSSPASEGALFKPGKKPKLVVHAAGDVGISGDGYRWRKYGQKMVKGNPHPRNYYRCTSAGCPVRKHIERAIDNTNALIITYKGKHDHDMPVPKKRHGPPSACLVAASAPASMNDMQFKRTKPVQSQKSATQWSVDMEGELTGEALDLGGEKAMESARTLLSIGFEIKPC